MEVTPNKGYSFTGWGGDCSGDSLTYQVDNIDKDLNCVANFKINSYTLTFDSDGGSAVVPITQDYDTPVTAPDDPTKEGYSFVGWDKQLPPTMPENGGSFKALWKVNSYTITFDSDGGSAVSPVTLDYGAGVTAPTSPTRAGYTFNGWSPALPETMPAENITVKASWKENVFVNPTTITTTTTATTTPVTTTTTVQPRTLADTPAVSGTTNATVVPEEKAKEAKEVKGTSQKEAKECPWWWIVGLVLIGAIVLLGVLLTRLKEDHFLRKYYYVWPTVLSAVAWFVHHWLQEGYQATWFCNNYWLLMLIVVVFGETLYYNLIKKSE